MKQGAKQRSTDTRKDGRICINRGYNNMNTLKYFGYTKEYPAKQNITHKLKRIWQLALILSMAVIIITYLTGVI